MNGEAERASIFPFSFFAFSLQGYRLLTSPSSIVGYHLYQIKVISRLRNSGLIFLQPVFHHPTLRYIIRIKEIVFRSQNAGRGKKNSTGYGRSGMVKMVRNAFNHERSMQVFEDLFYEDPGCFILHNTLIINIL